MPLNWSDLSAGLPLSSCNSLSVQADEYQTSPRDSTTKTGSLVLRDKRLFPQQLTQCLVQSKCSQNIRWMNEWMLWMYILFNVFRIISLWSHNYETTKVMKLVKQGFWCKQAINIIALSDSFYYGCITKRQIRAVHNYLQMTKNNSIQKY